MAIRWARRRLLIATVMAIALYYLLSSSYRTHEVSSILPHTKPEDVWEYLADFSHMKKLNPTIQGFRVLSEEGNKNLWKYTVEYDERLSHWPHSYNTAIGHYTVSKLSSADGGKYSVASQHQTCFLVGLFCLRSQGEFTISLVNLYDTLVTESVRFQCPFFFGSFCQREVEYQRTEIASKLKQHFQYLRQRRSEPNAGTG
ncbi:uncharacterized protein LOC128267163 [Anopheles cruzii]|uniref:uncharacterized protein LOC128267163 n=1 Tax=Anopheles cruzii TaxID=68878 RepID=UPI0022EC6F4C|nr:uncharacterized protein LOC128267163 [Anopheles cruzii]